MVADNSSPVLTPAAGSVFTHELSFALDWTVTVLRFPPGDSWRRSRRSALRLGRPRGGVPASLPRLRGLTGQPRSAIFRTPCSGMSTSARLNGAPQ